MHTLYFCCLAVLFHLNTLNQEMNQKQCCFRFLFTHWNIIRQYMLSDNTAAEYLGLEATVRFCTFITKFFIYFCNKHFFAKGFRFLLIRESEFVTVKSVHHWVFTFVLCSNLLTYVHLSKFCVYFCVQHSYFIGSH